MNLNLGRVEKRHKFVLHIPHYMPGTNAEYMKELSTFLHATVTYCANINACIVELMF
jgi:hypothetical protein